MDESEKKNKSSGEEEEVQQKQQHSSDYAPYPKLDPNDTAASSPSPSPSPPPVAAADNQGTFVTGSESNKSASDSVPVTRKSVSWSSELTRDAPPVANNVATTMPPESNPYISASPVPSSSSSVRETMESVRDTLGRWGKRVKEETKKAEDLAGNVWQHLKTAPSVTDAAMGRLMQSTKIIAEGGYEKVFQQSFETANDEQLLQSYACYLSTSAGPVMGTLYLSSAKIAFCSDNPLSYEVEGKKEWSYYKVVVPIHQLKAVNPSISRANSAEKYITIISVDSHEFWFMGFVNYDSAVKCLQEALQSRNSHSV